MYKLLALFSIFYLLPVTVGAYFMPTNIDSYTLTIYGNVTETIYNYDINDEINVVYAVTMQQEKDLSDTVVQCGSTTIAKNYGKDFTQTFLYTDCGTNDIQVVKSGNDEAFVNILHLKSIPEYALATTSTVVSAISDGRYNGPNLPEWLFIIGVFLFFNTINKWGYIFKPFREIKE